MCSVCDAIKDKHPKASSLEDAIGMAAADQAEAQMDYQVDHVLGSLADLLKSAGNSPVTPTEIKSFTGAFAGDMMFRQHPQVIAWTTAVLAHRYASLLGQWADLYVHENGSDLDGTEMLTPEQVAAVSHSPRAAKPE